MNFFMNNKSSDDWIRSPLLAPHLSLSWMNWAGPLNEKGSNRIGRRYSFSYESPHGLPIPSPLLQVHGNL